MKSINKAMEDVESSIGKIINEVEKPVKNILSFVNKHKKLIFTIALVYVAFKYLFNEDETTEEDEDY